MKTEPTRCPHFCRVMRYGMAALVFALATQVPVVAESKKMDRREAEALLEEQVQELLEKVRGKRVALVTNPTGVDGNFRMLADRIRDDAKTTVVAFFAPEHGLRGDAQAGAKIVDYVDPITSVPVYSLYGQRPAPTPEQLEGVEILVFDIQDVGARFYTYNWTMTHAMQAAARAKIPFVVFDRPNPIGADKVEGAPNTSDVGLIGRVFPGQPFGVATRHGLTIGELATLVNAEWLQEKADLTVIRMRGYRRNMTYDQTGRFWIPPSPNMPTLETAMVYPGMCVFEGTNLSEGRGTTKPFETVGAPFIRPEEVVAALKRKDLPGVRFRPTFFTPLFSKWQGQLCGGVQVYITDRESFRPVHTGLVVLKTLIELYSPKVEVTPFASKLMGVPDFHTRIRTESVEAIEATWADNLKRYEALRAKHLLYE
ncbi:MAG: DUF1343 domain-containing protein [Candidatus Hydrogenedentota bacterium]|uniref:DUF1343 domain-containing protein n=1 Tax=Sumerlaea chitinivorans TaxID=2250252 RepID=A0A2Z4Y5N6_SUMC1|nr:hypothetical protein BRCON_1764 [Candidatus Sumerlaea chitinivorans]RMH28655.1 MAG: DUF1343 domain-containing protein [Candidatus Hydrogenedentota bacterium]GIX45537.1 MAG: hypothetical protein KatS3mg130_1945 [Candidatus Sumerlaea sp.]